MPSEFDIINRYFAQANLIPPANDPHCLLGIGDDGALLQCSDQALTISVDTLAAGVHFPEEAPANLVGHRALIVNLSDLAAMGATPAYFTLALTLPWADETWIAEFAQGLAEAAKPHAIYLIGGDTTRGPLSITIQVMGYVTPAHALKRSGAKVGDAIYVTGTLGDAAAGLQIIQEELNGDAAAEEYLLQRYFKPTARIEVGKALAGIAHSAIDISDGLLADLSHILKASGVGACVNVDQLPLSPPLLSVMPKPQAVELALTAGDDYELCFTISATQESQLKKISEEVSITFTKIGEITADTDLQCMDEHQQPMQFSVLGFRHF